MSIQYLPQGVPVVSSSLSISGSYAILASNASAGLVATSSLAGHSLHAIGLTGSDFITRNAPITLANTGSQGLSIMVINTGSLAFKMATSSFSTEYGSNVGPIDPSASYGGGPGYNPTLNLVRGEQYRFIVRGAPPTAVDSTFFITNAGFSAYTFSGGAIGNNQTLTLIRGYRYEFRIDATGHPFWIQTTAGGYNASQVLPETSGSYNNGTQSGTLIFNVPHGAPNTLYYVCQFHSSMGGTINIIDDGLYRIVIQTASGSYNAGAIYNTGVTGNGIKSGSLTFAVTGSAPSTLYYASQDSSVIRGLINITG
jgi:hypothetical protein